MYGTCKGCQTYFALETDSPAALNPCPHCNEPLTACAADEALAYFRALQPPDMRGTPVEQD